MGKDLLFEFIGTAILIILGAGVVANVSLKKTYGNGAGWVVIALGWGAAVFVGVFISAPFSGGHLNPAVTIALAMTGKFHGSVVGYIIAQILGAIVGSVIIFLMYRSHFELEENPDIKKGVFCTAPAIRALARNFLSEAIGTFVLIFGLLLIDGANMEGPLPVFILIIAIGMSLGGTTGYAINPARDLGPRIAHAILPIKGKRDSDWGYAWVPVLGPIAGTVIAVGLYLLIHKF